MIPVDRVISFVWNEFMIDDAPQKQEYGFVLHRLNNAVMKLRDEVPDIPSDVTITTVAAQAEYDVGNTPTAVGEIQEIVFPSAWDKNMDWIPFTQLTTLQQKISAGVLEMYDDQPQYWSNYRNSSGKMKIIFADSTVITGGLNVLLKVTQATFPNYQLEQEILLPDSQEILLEYLLCRMCAGRFDRSRLKEFEELYRLELDDWKTKHAFTQSAVPVSYVDDQANVREHG